MYGVAVHNNCICNEARALCERHLVERRKVLVNEREWMNVARETKQYYRDKLTPLRYRTVIEGYSGNKKRRYIRALDNLRNGGLEPKHARVKMFVKNERFDSWAIERKPPRAIQYRTPEYNLCLMRYIKAFEEWYYPKLKYGVVSGTRIIAKGLNWKQRAELLVQKASHFVKPKYIMTDYTAFDSTIDVPHLKSTHSKYRKVFGAPLRLLNAQINNVGKTRHGIKYRVRGTRMSGDADTACGNTIVNLDAIHGVLRKSGISKYDMLVDGDDSVIIVEDESEYDVGYYEQLGLVVKHEVVHHLADVEFCQSRIVWTAAGPLFVRHPCKVLSNGALCRRDYPGRYDSWLAAVGACEKACNPGVPVLSVFGSVLDGLSASKLYDDDLKRRMEYMKMEDCSVAITMEARASMTRAWGIPIDVQIGLEKVIAEECMSYDLKDDEQLQRTRTWYECRYEPSSRSWWCRCSSGC